MSDPLYAFPTVCGQTMRALARYPSRTAFSWPGGSITYRGATELIGRIQKVFMQLGMKPGTRVALLTANRADSWCAGIAAQLSRFSITWLHPLGSRDDQIDQIEDSEAEILIIDPDSFLLRGGELAARAKGLRHVFSLGRTDYGVDLLVAVESAGSATAKDLAGPSDIATLNYTGGTTGKSKGALRYHREYGGFANAILSDFEIPDTPRYLTVASTCPPAARYSGLAAYDNLTAPGFAPSGAEASWRFTAPRETTIAGRAAILPTLQGRAWITGLHSYLLDPTGREHELILGRLTPIVAEHGHEQAGLLVPQVQRHRVPMEQLAGVLGDQLDQLTRIQRPPGRIRQLVQSPQQARTDLRRLIGSKARHVFLRDAGSGSAFHPKSSSLRT